MADNKRIAVVNDLSGFGRCSLTVALPILSAMGFQACPLPTAVLSAHTGYDKPHIRDCTVDMAASLEPWKRLHLQFDGVYTGFLGNQQQADVLIPFLQEAQNVFRLVDPAMADHGRLYASCPPAMVKGMGRLVALATVATPNLTEACLLTDTPYEPLLEMPADERRGVVERMARQLLQSGCESVVITGVPEGARLENAVLERLDAPVSWIGCQRVERYFAGTGDVFAAVLCGHLMNGLALCAAVEQTVAFVRRVTEYTALSGGPEQDGVAFEAFLRELCP